MKVKDLKGSPYNPRRISDRQMEMLKKSMHEFGDLSGIVRNRRTGNLVGGHQRLKHFQPSWEIVAAPHTDAVGTVAAGHIKTPFGDWTYREVDWDEQKEKGANISANKQGGEFEPALLRELLLELDTGAFDMDLTGFDSKEIEDLMTQYAPPDTKEIVEDDFDAEAEAEKIQTAITKRGDIIMLGRHRLMCGDSTSATDMAMLMDGKVADCIWTDPPYGVDYTEKNNFIHKTRAGIAHRKIAGDELRKEGLEDFLSQAFMVTSNHLKAGGCVYIAHADVMSSVEFLKSIQGAGIYISQTIIWVKNIAVLSRKDYNWRHEPILYGWKEGAGHYFCMDFTNTTIYDDQTDPAKMSKEELLAAYRELQNRMAESVVRENRPTVSPLHPTMKPVKLVAKLIRNSTRPEAKEIVLDPFMGSGTTLIACEQTGRVAYGMELDPVYVDVQVLRWEQFTGKKAIRP